MTVHRDVFPTRVVAGIERIIDRHPRQTVAMVWQGGVIRQYASAILSKPREQVQFFSPLYMSISRVRHRRAHDRLSERDRSPARDRATHRGLKRTRPCAGPGLARAGEYRSLTAGPANERSTPRPRRSENGAFDLGLLRSGARI
jgi:hypothetical protein